MISNTRGFTLIEMIGALAVLSILAAVLVPNLITRSENVAVDIEQASLKNLSNSLEEFIIRTRSIPSQGVAGNWAWALGSQSAIPTPQILNNELGVARQFIIDPAFVAAIMAQPGYAPGVAPAGSPAAPFYTQQFTGLGGFNLLAPLVLPPLRIMLVSDLRKTGPNGVGLPAMLPPLATAAAFNAAWDQTLPAADPWRERDSIVNPAGLAADGPNRTGLVIQRMNLSHLFHRVTLRSAYNGLPPMPSYQIENLAPVPVQPVVAGNVPPGPFHEILAFHGTRLSLITSADAAGLTTLAFVQIIKGPESFDYPREQVLPATVPPTYTFKWTR